MNPYIQAQQHDARVALQDMLGQSIDHEPLWKKGYDGKKYLTYAGAVDLIKLFGITVEVASVTPSIMNKHHFPKSVYHAVVKAHVASRSQFGASSSRDEAVAIRLAMRNAVRGLFVA